MKLKNWLMNQPPDEPTNEDTKEYYLPSDLQGMQARRWLSDLALYHAAISKANQPKDMD